MRDRQKIETLLARRFPGSTPGQIAAAANAIMGLDESSDKPSHGQFSDVDAKGPTAAPVGTGDRGQRLVGK